MTRLKSPNTLPRAGGAMPVTTLPPAVAGSLVSGSLPVAQRIPRFEKLFYSAPSDRNVELLCGAGTANIRAMRAYGFPSIRLKRERELGYFGDSAKDKRQPLPCSTVADS